MAATCDEHAPAVRLFDGVRPQGRTLQRWPYAAIVHAFAEDRRDEILAHQSRPEIRMRVRNDAVYNAIRERAPQLRQLRRGGRFFWATMAGMPDQARLGVIILIGLVALMIYSFAKDLFD